MTTRFHLESWRKIYRVLPPSWLALPLSARGLGSELLKYVDQEGVFALPVGESEADGVCRIMCAHRKEWRRVADDIAALLADGYLVRVPNGLKIRNYVEAQARTPSAERMARKRARDANSDGTTKRHSDANSDAVVTVTGASQSDGHDTTRHDTTRDLAKADPLPPLSQQGRPTPATEPSGGGGMNPAIAAIRETLATSLRLRHLAGSELPARIASHCREHGHMGRHSLADVVRSVTEADAKLADLAAAGEEVPNARIVSLVVGCVKAGLKPEPKPTQTTTRRAPWLPPVQPMTPSTARVLSGPIDESAIDDDASPFAATPPRRAV